jgi:hypothetical protein
LHDIGKGALATGVLKTVIDAPDPLAAAYWAFIAALCFVVAYQLEKEL